MGMFKNFRGRLIKEYRNREENEPFSARTFKVCRESEVSEYITIRLEELEHFLKIL